MCFPWTSALPLIVSLYGTFGVCKITSAPNLFFILLAITSKWVSPNPQIIVSAFSLSLSILKTGSSSLSLDRAKEIFSSSPFALGSIAIGITGTGRLILLYLILSSWLHKVSPVDVNCNLATAPISPAIISSVAIWFFPLIKNKWDSFSCLPLLVFFTTVSPFNFPVITLNNEIFPTKGSAIVLNT